jgi:uncharacterized membrane protein (Fun14 family)
LFVFNFSFIKICLCILGTILARSFASVEHLQEVGVKTLQARALYTLISSWKEAGVPMEVFANAPTAPQSSATTTDESDSAKV